MQIIEIAGIDFSINSPGVVKIKLNSETLDVLGHDYLGFTQIKKDLKINPKLKTYEKFNNKFIQTDYITDEIIEFVKDCSYVVLEDYSFSSIGDTARIHEMTGIMKLKLCRNKIPFKVYNILKIKKFILRGEKQEKTKDKKIPIVNKYFTSTNNILGFPFPKEYLYKNPYNDIIDAYYMASMLRFELLLRNSLIKKEDLCKIDEEVFFGIGKKEAKVLDDEFIIS